MFLLFGHDNSTKFVASRYFQTFFLMIFCYLDEYSILRFPSLLSDIRFLKVHLFLCLQILICSL